MLLLVVPLRRFLLRALGVFVVLPAQADVLGIPSDPRFTTAHYPFARVVDGCTSWRQPSHLGQNFGSVDFGGACQKHDMCFHTVGRSWGECNQEYLSALREACDRDLQRQRLEQSRPGKTDLQALHLCYDLTNLFMAQVQRPAAIKRYELAQKQQHQYLLHVRATIQSMFVATLSRPATEDEEDEALARLDAGISLVEMRDALAVAKADRRAKLIQIEPPSELPAIDEASLRGLFSSESVPKVEGKIK